MLALVTCAGAIEAQEPPPTPSPDVSSSQQRGQQPVVAPCVQPAPMVNWSDYQGPFAKGVGIFGRRLERKAVHAPHYKPGAVLCTLELKDKFLLFAQTTVDPVTFLRAGFDAGIGQAGNNDPSFGQGAAGYGHRFGIDLVDQASSDFFKDFVYPSILSEDPRYYRLAHGGTRTRFFHALEHSVVAYREDGTRMFNFSEWLGTTSAVVLSNTYHPDNQRGFSPAAQRVGYAVASDAGFDVLREFWPEIARKFKLPFRGQREP